MDDFPKDFVSIGAVENVYTTHVIHQEQFYVHLDTRSSILEEIMDALELRYSQLGPDDKPLLQLKLGGLCAAKFTDDNNWYRVKITGLLNSGLIEVYFVDYGNIDYVSADRVKKLDPDLIQYPVQSYRCALTGVSCKHGVWTPELRVQFEDLVVDKRCKAVFSGKTGEDIYLLDMYDEQGNYINEMFGATEKKNPARSNKVNGNGVAQGFSSITWREGHKVQALVVYVANPDLFWCQEVAHTNNIIILSEELSRLHMTQEMGLLQDVRPGSICAAKFSEDDAWYRGIIQSVSGNKSQVYFVDYGNTESVELDSLCELKQEFRHLPALGVKCTLTSTNRDNGNKWSALAIEEFEKLVVDKEFEVSVTGRCHDGYEVSLLDIEENKDVASQFKQVLSQGIKAQTPPKAVNINNNSQSQSIGRGLDLPVGSACNVFLSWVDNPTDFWVQQEQLSDILDKLTSELQEYYAQPRPMALSAPGAFVIARFSEDQQWYRGLVVKEFEDRVKVLFIDFGNADIIPKTELRQVNPQFGQIDPLAFRCSLKGVKPLPQDNSWSVDAKEFLENLTESGCQCEVLGKNDAYRFVALNVNGKDVAQELVAAAVVAGSQPPQVKANILHYAGSPRMHENQTEQALVTHIDSPNSIWVQLSKHHPELDAVMEKLDSHYSEDGGTPVSKPTIGQACVALYSLDNAWYRAVITNISPSGYDVHFVDYGNREVVASSLACVAEPRFLDLPSQAIKCRLSSSGDVSHLKDTLSDLVLEKDVTLKVTSAGEVPSVDLIIEGQSVCSMLRNQGGNMKQNGGDTLSLKPPNPIPQGSTINAFVSVVQSPDRFFLQIAGIDDELTALMDLLAQQYVPQNVPVISQPSVGMYCVAMYEDDEQWYRGQIKSVQGGQCQVLFVDYGNEELVSNELIKAITPEVSKAPILAYECSLHGVKADAWSESSISHFESLVMDQQLSCAFVSRSAVTVLCNGEDIGAKMISAGHCHLAGMSGPKSPVSVSTGQSGFGSRSPKSPGFGQSPVKDQSSPRGFGGNRREERSFGESREDNRGFGGGGREERGFGGGGREERGGGGRREKSGFGGADGDDDGSDRGGFKPRSRDGDTGGFGQRDGNSSSFGGGRRERNTSSASGTAEKFTYADPPTEAESAILVHIDDDGTFYLQLPSMEKDILFLSKRLAGSYKSGGPRLKESAAKGTICCCKFPDDGSMYRCQVEAVEGNKVLVRYMDFGNMAEHTMFDLKFLFPDLLQYSVQAFPCQLRGLEWSLDKADTFGVATLDKDLEVTFTNSSAPYQVDIKTPDGDLLAIMTGQIIPPAPKIPSTSQSSPGQGGRFGARSKGFGGGMDTSTPKKSDMPSKRSLNLTSSPPAPSVPNQVFIAQTTPSESQSAFISHISEEGYFYVQLEKDTTLLDSLTEKLTKINSSISHPGLIKGASCAAVFSEDSSWYRALITKIEGDEFTVTFVDFGNGDKVSKQSICPLNEDLLSSAPLAYQCRFADEDEALSDVSKAKLEEYLMEHQITISFSGQSAPFAVVASTSDGQDLHEIVCPSNHFRSQVIPKEVTPVGICHIENDGRFFTGFFKKYKAKANLQKRLQDHCGSSPESLENPEVDMPCCAKALSDDLWHRCKIVGISDSKADIQYVDNGKCDSVEISDLKALPSDFLKEAPFALECRMKGVDSWTDDLKEKFIDMTQDKILNATFYSTSPPFRISLARSIELDLLGLNAPEPDSPRKEINECVIANATKNRSAVFQGGDSYITEIISQGYFFVQLVTEEEQLQSLCDSLEAIMTSSQNEPDDVEVGTAVCAKFTEDDVWYRATVEVLEEDDKYTVRFIDYGNTDTVGKDRLSTLPEELSTISIPAFAYKCKSAEDISQLEEFKTAVMDKMVTTEVTSTDDEGVFHVNVKIDGQAVMLNQESEVFEAKIEDKQDAEASSKRTTVTVAFVISPSEFYVQLQSNEAQLDSMMNGLYEDLTSLAEGEGMVNDAVAVGDLCAALYEESWYRVRVTDLAEDETVQVLFIDHGNTETLSNKSELRALSPKYAYLPLYGHKASLPGIKPVSADWTEEAIEAFRSLVEEKSLLADLINTSDDEPWVVQLLDMGTPVQDTLIAKGHGVATESVAISKSTQRVFSDANESVMVSADETVPGGEVAQNWKNKIGCISDTLEELKQVTAFVSHCDSPSQIWCQLSSSTDDLEELADKLEVAYTSIHDSDKVVGNVNIDDLVIGLFEDDGMHYRSLVLNSPSENSSESDKVSLRFIDYGNCGFSTKDHILTVKEELCKQPALAFCCCLDKIQPVDGEWSSEACNRCAELVADQELLLMMVGRKQDRTVLVDLVLQETGKSVSDLLVEEGLVKKLEMDTSLQVKVGGGKGDVSECLEITQPIMESTAMIDETSPYSIVDAIDGYYRCIELSLHSSYDVVVSDDELPNAFCVQLKEMSSQYEDLMKDIAEYIANDDGDDKSPKVGDPCLVLYESMWYRGLIRMETNGGDWIVVSVDCGWEVGLPSDKVRSIPDRFLELPTQAIHCYLAGIVSQEPEWSAEAITYFTEFLQDQCEHIHIDIQESAEDGKYGVTLTDTLESSTDGSPSLNHLFVEMAFAEIVPGSNVEFEFDMDKPMDTDMLNELEQSFKEVELTKNNDMEGDDPTEASTSQADTFMSTKEGEQQLCKAPLEVGSKFYQLVHLSKTDAEGQSLAENRNITQGEKNSDEMALTKKDLAFNIASAVDRIDQMGCIDLFPEDSLTFDLTSDAESLLEVSKNNQALITKMENTNTSVNVQDKERKVIPTPDNANDKDKHLLTSDEEISSESKARKGSSKSPLYTWSSQSQSPDNTNDSLPSLDKTPVANDNGDGEQAVTQGKVEATTDSKKLKNASVNEASSITDMPGMSVVSDDEISPEEMVEKDVIIEAIREEIEWRQESVKVLSVEEEEKILLPYEYYEALENGIGDTVNGKNVCSCEYEEDLSVTDAKNKEVCNRREDKHSVVVDHTYYTEDNPTENEKAACSSECKENLIVDNDQAETQMSEDDDVVDASFITLDETGFDEDINQTGELTDGYHGSASGDASSYVDQEENETVSLEVKDKNGVNDHGQQEYKGETIVHENSKLKVTDSLDDVNSSILDDKNPSSGKLDIPCAVNESENDQCEINGSNITCESGHPGVSKDKPSCIEEIECETITTVSFSEKPIISCEDKKMNTLEYQIDSLYVEMTDTKLVGEEGRIECDSVKDHCSGGQIQLVEDKEVIVVKDIFKGENLKASNDIGIAEDDRAGGDCRHVSVVTGDASVERSTVSLESDLQTVDGTSTNNKSKEIDQVYNLTADTTEEDQEVLGVHDDLPVDGEMSSNLHPTDQGIMTSDEDDDALVAYVSTLDDTDTYESASENVDDFERTDSFNSSNLVRDMSERYLSTSDDSSFDQSGMYRSELETDSSSYDTSSLVFSDSHLESSYADSSASTQTTEVSALASDTDTSTAYKFDENSTNEESSFTHNDTSSSAGSMSSMVNAASKALSLSSQSNEEIPNSYSDIAVFEADIQDQAALANTIAVSIEENALVKKDVVSCDIEREIVKDEVPSVNKDFDHSNAIVEDDEFGGKEITKNSPVVEIKTEKGTMQVDDSLSHVKQSIDENIGNDGVDLVINRKLDSDQSGPPSFHSADNDDDDAIEDETETGAIESTEGKEGDDEKGDSYDDAVELEANVQEDETQNDIGAVEAPVVGDNDAPNQINEKVDDAASGDDEIEESTVSNEENTDSNIQSEKHEEAGVLLDEAKESEDKVESDSNQSEKHEEAGVLLDEAKESEDNVESDSNQSEKNDEAGVLLVEAKESEDIVESEA